MNLKELFVTHCSPTFAGLKPSNLFTINANDINNNIGELRIIIRQIKSSGLSVRMICKCRDRVLVLVYRKEMLEKSIDIEKRNFLHTMDYPESDDLEIYINYLAKKLKREDSFPHEIGVFLGIPLEDIHGYIENRGKSFKHCGYWKVYGDCEGCKKLFSDFRNSFIENINKIRNGAEIEELIS